MMINFPGSELHKLSDADLIRQYKSGSQAAFQQLAARYLFLIRSKTSGFRGCGADTDDLIQEGLLALHYAAGAYDDKSGASFSAFAGVCIKNRLCSFVRGLNSDKNRLNRVASSIEDEQDIPLMSELEPDNILIIKEELESIGRIIRETLSETEYAVLSLYLDGKTYNEIAQELSISRKACDNAMQRVRRKLKAQC